MAKHFVSQAERDLLEKDDARGHMDVISELGCELRQPIPKGEAFLEWIADLDTQIACTTALLRRGFTWEEIRAGFFDLSRWRWDPPVAQLQLASGMSP